jgi:hypothetical protein
MAPTHPLCGRCGALPAGCSQSPIYAESPGTDRQPIRESRVVGMEFTYRCTQGHIWKVVERDDQPGDAA